MYTKTFYFSVCFDKHHEACGIPNIMQIINIAKYIGAVSLNQSLYERQLQQPMKIFLVSPKIRNNFCFTVNFFNIGLFYIHPNSAIALPPLRQIQLLLFLTLKGEVKKNLSLSSLRASKGNGGKKQRNYTKKEAKNIESDYFTITNGEKSKIAIAILEKFIIGEHYNYFVFWGVPLISSPLVAARCS